MQTQRIIFLCPYFGPLPAWFPLFVRSCETNADVDFVLITDQTPEHIPSNVRVYGLSFSDFLARVQKALGIQVAWTGAYKVCDLKPALAYIFQELLTEHSHWGFCDMDLIFGRITHFYDAEVLGYDLISTHSGILSGHLAVFSNKPETRTLFAGVKGWREIFADPEYRQFDEFDIAILALGQKHLRYMCAPQVKVNVHVNDKPLRCLFREQYSTFVEPQLWRDGTLRLPGHWEWKDGVLSAPFLDNSEMLYVHFLHWCSKRWIRSRETSWARLPQLIHPSLVARPQAFSISADGFLPLPA